MIRSIIVKHVIRRSAQLGEAFGKKKEVGRPRSEKPMVHTAVVLPADLISWLKESGKANGLGLSAEIRARLATTYLMLQGTRSDPETYALIHAIRHLSDFLARDLGKRWHEHPYAMAAFKAGVADLLARFQLEGDEKGASRYAGCR